MSHTPGPWSDRGYNAKGNRIVADGDFYHIALVYLGNSDDGDSDPVKANARLIAEAPWLLRALKRIAWEPQGPADASDRQVLDACVEIAKEAIERATGETGNALYGEEEPPEPRGEEVWARVNIYTNEGADRVRVHVETNDDNDDGHPDPDIWRFTIHPPTLEAALKRFGGGSHVGLMGHRVDVFVDGKKV